MRPTAALLATLASAVCYSRCFPTAAVRPLAWVVLVPFFVAVRRTTAWQAVFLAWVWSVVAAYGLNDWFPRAVSTYYAQPALVGIVFFLGVSTFTAAPYYMLFAACYHRLGTRRRAVLPLFAAAAWVAAELARTELFIGDPWALLGYSQIDALPLVQVADLTGVYGISFVVAAVNAALAELWLAVRSQPRGIRTELAGCGLAAGLTALVFAYGVYRLPTVSAATTDAPAVSVAVAQANLDLGSQWRSDFYGRNLDAYLQLSLRAIREYRPALLVWPESALTFFLADEPLYRRAIGRLLAPSGVELVTGGPRTLNSEAPRYYNSAFLVAPDGEIRAWYDKEHLLAFAEYFPVPWLDFLRREFGRVREFTPGSSTPPLPTVAGPAGVIICNEALFPQPAAARVRAGAVYLVNLSNDSWVGEPKYSEQAFDMVVLRAVEQRRYLVRASTSGPSAIVDPAGRVLTRTVPFTAALVAGHVRPVSGQTVYATIGDAFAILCAIVAVAAWAAIGRGYRRP